MDVAAEGRAKKRFARELPRTTCPLSRKGLLARPRILLRVRAAGVPARLARGSVGSRAEPECDLAYGLRGLVALVECAERLRQALAAPATAALRRNRCAAVEDLGGRSSCAAIPRLARASRDGLAVATVVLGLAEPAGDQSRRPHGEMRRRGRDPAAHCGNNHGLTRPR